MANTTNKPDYNVVPTETCFVDDKMGETICILDFSVDDGKTRIEHFMCEATMDGKACNSCVYFGRGICWSNSLEEVGGYRLDCSSVNHRYKEMDLCGNRLSIRSYSGGSSGDDASFVAWLLLGFLIAGLRCYLLCARRRGHLRRTYDSVAVEQDGLVNTREVELPAARALEVLHDSAKPFRFYDAAMDDPLALELKKKCASQDWRAVREFFQQLETVPLRAFYGKVFADTIAEAWDNGETTLCPMLDEWFAEDSGSFDCRFLRLEALIRWAWHARTGSLGHLVTPEARARFHERLQQASTELNEVAFQTDPLLLASAISIEKGLNGRPGSVAKHLKALKDTPDPFNYDAYLQALQYYCRDWYGPHEDMFTFARSTVKELPDGHPLWMLIPYAHYERQLLEEVPGYWERFEVREELLNAYNHAFAEYETSLNPIMDVAAKRMDWISRNWFAYALARTGGAQADLARRQFRVIGKRPIGCHPWGHLGKYKLILKDLGFEVEQQEVAVAVEVV